MALIVEMISTFGSRAMGGLKGTRGRSSNWRPGNISTDSNRTALGRGRGETYLLGNVGSPRSPGSPSPLSSIALEMILTMQRPVRMEATSSDTWRTGGLQCSCRGNQGLILRGQAWRLREAILDLKGQGMACPPAIVAEQRRWHLDE